MELAVKILTRDTTMSPISRHVKKQLFQFMNRQLALSNGDRGEVYQIKSRQKLRRGPFPDLVLRTMAEPGIRYLIVLHFTNFVSIYYTDAHGTIMNVKNFDRKRDHKLITELPRLAKRIFVSRSEKKEPTKHDCLLKKTEAVQYQFRRIIQEIEKLVGVRIPPSVSDVTLLIGAWKNSGTRHGGIHS